ncbi:MAG: hypothetical protein HYT87_18455 [Nitrospirae bacterium]|nr:hypothetical protein [Nitrospirota bacterium]
MSKPIRPVRITTANGKKTVLHAVVDTGSFHTIVRSDVLPAGTPIHPSVIAKQLRTAGKGGKVRISGGTYLVLLLEGKLIDTHALVSPDLHQPMIIGAGTMQMWDVSVLNKNGDTQVRVGRDMRDPEITEVD